MAAASTGGLHSTILGFLALLRLHRVDAIGVLRQVQQDMTPVNLPGSERIEAGWSTPLTRTSDLMGFFNMSSKQPGLLSMDVLWHKDIFAPTASGYNVFFHLLQDASVVDWLILFGVALVLIAVDAFLLQPGSRRDHEAPRDQDAFLLQPAGQQGHGGQKRQDAPKAMEDGRLQGALGSRDADGGRHAPKAELLRVGKGTATEGRLQTSGVPEGNAITWEEFHGLRAPEVTGGVPSADFSVSTSWRNVAVLAFWVLMGLAFNAMIFCLRGREAGINWCSGYLLEWLLSMDNLFVFHLIFRTYATPRELLHKALFLGIVGAVAFRMCFFLVLSSLLHVVKWVRFVFGLMLIYSGIQAAHGDDSEEDPSKTLAVRMLKWCLGSRLVETYDVEGRRLFVRGDDGELRATLLVPVIFCLEITDVFFAIDSISAKVAQIPNYYIAYSSSVLAIFGLRAMFFIIQDLVDYFDLVKYGLCFILVFIGIELMIADFVKLPAHVVCVVILSVFLVCVAGAMLQHMFRDKKENLAEPEIAGRQEGEHRPRTSSN